jgi:hypothetical protein
MAFINDINLIAALYGCKLCAFDDFPNIINPGVAGSINLNHINGVT